MCPGKEYPENCWGVKAAITAGGIRHQEQRELPSVERQQEELNHRGAGGKDPNITV